MKWRLLESYYENFYDYEACGCFYRSKTSGKKNWFTGIIKNLILKSKFQRCGKQTNYLILIIKKKYSQNEPTKSIGHQNFLFLIVSQYILSEPELTHQSSQFGQIFESHNRCSISLWPSSEKMSFSTEISEFICCFVHYGELWCSKTVYCFINIK